MAASGLITDGGLPPSNSWVLPEHKMVYISVTKVACSGLRWMLADLAGEEPERFYRAAGPHLTRLMTVHGVRERWQHVDRLSAMPREAVDQVSPDNGWLVFAVVRDPWSRLWSAWQSKFLVQHPSFVRNYSDQPWFPRVPDTVEDVLEDWRAFIKAHPWTELPQLAKDSHFWAQERSVRPHGLAYSRVYDLARLSELTDDIHAHLAPLGLDQELYLPRANETPLAMTEDVLAEGVAESIEELYAADFDEFGDRWDRAALKLRPRWTDDAIRAVGFQVAVNERVGDLSTQAMGLGQQLRETRQQLKATRQEPKGVRRELAAQPPPRSVAERAVRRAGRAVKRVARR